MGQPQERRPALREPMFWLVWGLPAVVVVASLVTVWLAVTAGNADPVRDDVRRMAQVQTAELSRDERAAQLGLEAVLSLRDGQVLLLPLAGDFPRGRPLQLVLGHPTHALQDHQVTLQPQANGWGAALQADGSHDWQAEVASGSDDGWRIRGRLKAGERAVRLAPALPAQ